MMWAKPWAFLIQDQVTLGIPNQPRVHAKETGHREAE